MNLIVTIAVCVVVLYSGLLLAIWRFQELLVFQPPRVTPQSPAQARRVSFRASDGEELVAHVVGEYAPGRTVVLAFHGNAQIARWLIPWATSVAKMDGVCVVLPEYRGYDGLAGRPSYLGVTRDASAALLYVRETMRAPQTDIVYFGHSLGSAVAAELAASSPPRTLILQAPFSSANEMSRRYFFVAPPFLLMLLSRVHFDTIARVRALPCPVWVAHGARDVIVPLSMGRAVFESARVKGELLVLPQAGHNDVAGMGGEAYWGWLRRAIADDEPTATRDAPGETRSAP